MVVNICSCSYDCHLPQTSPSSGRFESAANTCSLNKTDSCLEDNIWRLNSLHGFNKIEQFLRHRLKKYTDFCGYFLERILSPFTRSQVQLKLEVEISGNQKLLPLSTRFNYKPETAYKDCRLSRARQQLSFHPPCFPLHRTSSWRFRSFPLP